MAHAYVRRIVRAAGMSCLVDSEFMMARDYTPIGEKVNIEVNESCEKVNAI
jgi:hypothetical protein